MLAFDNSQISEQSINQNSEKSQMQDLNQIRQMLPEGINRMNEYLIPKQDDEKEEEQSLITRQEYQMMLKIRKQTHQILELQEKLYYYRTQCLRLIDQNQQIKENIHQIQVDSQRKEQYSHQLQKKLQEQYKKVSHLQRQIQKKDQKIEELNQNLVKKTQKKEKQTPLHNTYNHELLSKQLLLQQKIILDLTMRNQKILKINALLQKQLRIAEDKLITLQIQVQQKMCSVLIDNVSRLKQNQAHFCKSIQDYSSSVSRPIEQNRTVKLQDSSSQNRQSFKKQFKTIEKSPILKTIDHRHDYKLSPVQSPKPQRKSNRAFNFCKRQGQQRQRYKQHNRYKF